MPGGDAPGGRIDARLAGRSRARCTLLAFIDDATSRVHARFYPAETTEGYFDLFGRYVRKYGLPVSVYTDRSGIFRTERKKQRETDVEREPQFARALEQLGVRRNIAHSPQAKGRVERLFGTLQDRWTKALRESGVNSIDRANALLDGSLLESFNQRFTVAASSALDAHRPGPGVSTQSALLCVHEERTVANDYTIRHGKKVYQLVEPLPPNLRGSTVAVQSRLDGDIRFTRPGEPERYLTWRAVLPSAPVLPPPPAGAPGRGKRTVLKS